MVKKTDLYSQFKVNYKQGDTFCSEHFGKVFFFVATDGYSADLALSSKSVLKIQKLLRCETCK